MTGGSSVSSKVEELSGGVVAHEHSERLRGLGIEQPEVLPETGQLRMRVSVGDTNVLAGRDVVLVADQLEAQVVGERMGDDVNALPALPGGGGVGDPLQPGSVRVERSGSGCPARKSAS
jgi:hypothetical protein